MTVLFSIRIKSLENRQNEKLEFSVQLSENSGNSQLKIKWCLRFSKAIKHHFQPIAKRNIKQCPQGLLKLICCMRFLFWVTSKH